MNSAVYEVMKIESEAFEEKYRGDAESILRRYRVYPDMLDFVYDGFKTVGYLCWFPIKESLYSDIIASEDLHDDEIEPEQIEPDLGKASHIYLLSVAAYPSYKGKGYGTSMMETFLKRVQSIPNLKDVLASAVTPDGERICEKFGFKFVKDCGSFKVYRRDL